MIVTFRVGFLLPTPCHSKEELTELKAKPRFGRITELVPTPHSSEGRFYPWALIMETSLPAL